jgi:hypothetical protein
MTDNARCVCVCVCVCACLRVFVCVCVFVCVSACVRLTTVSWTAHQPSAHPLTCPERRAHEYTSHALTSLQQARSHRAERSRNTTQASTTSNLPNLHAHVPDTTQPPQQLRLVPTCNASEHHPREHHPPRNNAHATSTRLRATRQNTRETPANQARVLKHDNSPSASKRTSAKAAQHTPPPHAGASSPCPSSFPARRADEPQQPKPPKHQSAISITATSAAIMTTTRRCQRSLNNTEVIVVLVVFLGGLRRDS